MERFATARAALKPSSMSGKELLLWAAAPAKMDVPTVSPAENRGIMGKSHQAGWVSTRGKYWYGYYRETVLDPETNEERVKKIPIRLGLKTQLNKLKASNVLREEITKRSGRVPEGRVLKDSSVTFEWFVRNRYFPLRQGDWRPETAVTKMEQIEIDLIGKFGEYPLALLSGPDQTGAVLLEVDLR
jgi:hypothetical protein